MRRILAVVLALLAGAAAPFVQTALTDLAGRGGTGGCPTFAAPPGGSVFFLDPLNRPAGVAVDPNGKLFVSSGANCVWRLDADGLLRMGFLDSAPFRIGTGAAAFSDGGPAFDASSALLSNPMNLALDAAGSLYIADASNHRIRKVDIATWTISTVAGGGSLRPIDGINATDASFLFPVGVAVDPGGNVYVSDSNAAKVFKVDRSGILTRFAGSGAFTYSGENIPATSSGMIPMGIASDLAGNIFIADWSNSIVRKVTPDGNITTVAGTPFNSTVLGDGGPAVGAALTKPRGVAVDASGNIFIADTDGHRVRMVDQAGIITTVAGNGIAGGDNGELNFPTAVAADNLGNVFIADTANNKLRGIIVAPRTYRLTLNAIGSGAVSGGGTYDVGQMVPVVATASAGSTFAGWSGPNAAECTTAGAVLMTADKSCTATFTNAPDTTPPVLSGMPASLTVNTTNPGGTSVSYAVPTATDPDDTAGPVTCNPPSGTIFPLGVTTVTCSATDTHGNTGSASFTVTVAPANPTISIAVSELISVADDTPVKLPMPLLVEESIAVFDGDVVVGPDRTPPVFSGVPTSVTTPAVSVNGALVTYTPPTATDPDDPAGAVSCSPASGSLFPIGTTTVTCTSTDTHGNTGTVSFPVIVSVVAPLVSLVVPESISVDDGGGRVMAPLPLLVLESVSVSDTSGSVAAPLPLLVFESIAVTDSPVLPPAVALVVQESISVADSGSAIILDTTPPVVTVPASVTVGATSSGGAVVVFLAAATDPDDAAGPVACLPASGSVFAIGATIVQCRSTDTHGNLGTATFVVTVLTPVQTLTNLVGAAAAAGLSQSVNLLQNATLSVNQHNLRAACGQLTAFDNQVAAQAGKALTRAEAADLLHGAADVKATLGCR